jgi:hypothetical protein
MSRQSAVLAVDVVGGISFSLAELSRFSGMLSTSVMPPVVAG